MRERSTFTKKALPGLVAAGIVLLALAVTGCVCCSLGGNPAEVTPTPEPEPTDLPVTTAPTTLPTVPTYVVTSMPTSGVTVGPSPGATAAATPAAGGTVDARIVDYGTDKDTYNKGDTATCYVDIENTGDVTINRVDFRIDVYTSRYGITVHAINNQTYTVDQQDIQPSSTKRVELSVVIPKKYGSIDTAGDYRFDIVVYAEGKNIGSFSKDVKVV